MKFFATIALFVALAQAKETAEIEE